MWHPVCSCPAFFICWHKLGKHMTALCGACSVDSSCCQLLLLLLVYLFWLQQLFELATKCRSSGSVCVVVSGCSPTKAKGHATQSSDNNYGIRYYSYFLVIKFTAATTEAPFALIHSLSLSRSLSHSPRSGKWVVEVARCCNHFNMHRKSQTKQRKMATKPLQQLEASGQLPTPPLPSLLPPQSQCRMQLVGCSSHASRASDASLAAKRRKQCRAQEKEIKTWAQLNKKCASHKR